MFNNVKQRIENIKETISNFADDLKLKKKVKDAEEVDYPAYGVTGPTQEEVEDEIPTPPPNGDKVLAQSAHMYHYQHQKQQIIALENSNQNQRRGSESISDEDDFTVYECPGLANTGEMEVKNPMFKDGEAGGKEKDAANASIPTTATATATKKQISATEKPKKHVQLKSPTK